MPGLDEAVRQVLAAACAALETAPELTEVRTVVRGPLARPLPELPAIWVVPEPAGQDADAYGPAETWTLPVSLAALVRDDDPERGASAAARLAAAARKAVLRGIPFPWVVWVRSRSADLAPARDERNRNLHWADVTVEVRFSVEED